VRCPSCGNHQDRSRPYFAALRARHVRAFVLLLVRIPLIVNAGSGIVNADSGDRERSIGAKRR
jgi:hypothetical protein